MHFIYIMHDFVEDKADGKNMKSYNRFDEDDHIKQIVRLYKQIISLFQPFLLD